MNTTYRARLIDLPLLLGSSLSGLGWGFVGLCQGPTLFLGVASSPSVGLSWMPAFFCCVLLDTNVKTASPPPCIADAEDPLPEVIRIEESQDTFNIGEAYAYGVVVCIDIAVI